MKAPLAVPVTLLLAASTACSPAAPPEEEQPPEQTGDTSNPETSDDDRPRPEPTSISGTYRVATELDLSANLPGGADGAIGTLLDAGDDPGRWLMELVVEETGAPSFLVGVGAGIVNDLIDDQAPELVQDLLDVADAMSAAAESFGMLTELDVRSGVATHTLVGYQFSIDGKMSGFSLDDLGSDESVAREVEVVLEGGKLTISEHEMPLRYGGALAWLIDNRIASMVDSGARGLEDLLVRNVDCYAVAQKLQPSISFVSVSTIADWCEEGIEMGAKLVLKELKQIDQHAPLVLKMSGEARGSADSSGNVASFEAGRWSGTLSFGDSSAELVQDKASFTGTSGRGGNTDPRGGGDGKK